MAVATFDVHTVRFKGKMAVRDFANGIVSNLDAAGNWLNDDEYDDILYDNLITEESTYTLTRLTTGIYKYLGGLGAIVPPVPGISLVLSDDATPFTGDNDVNYTVYAQGLKVKAETVGGNVRVDHSSTTIDIVGAPVDFNRYVSELFIYLKSQKMTQITQSIDSATFTIDNTMQRLDSAIAMWQGAITSGT